MKAACYIKKDSLKTSPEVLSMLDSFRAVGIRTYSADGASEIDEDTDWIVSIGGDGTFLSASTIAAEKNIPLLGVNFGHLGFLAEAPLEDIPSRLADGRYSIVGRRMLEIMMPMPECESHLALNEAVLHRTGHKTIGIDISINGVSLPTCWADGVIVSTASGSTAYNLSAGGPICTPDTDVIIVTPIAPHNLGVRPLLIPGSSEVCLSVHGDACNASLSLDNRTLDIPENGRIIVKRSPGELKCISFGKESFINALKNRLFWGADVRNSR